MLATYRTGKARTIETEVLSKRKELRYPREGQGGNKKQKTLLRRQGGDAFAWY